MVRVLLKKGFSFTDAERVVHEGPKEMDISEAQATNFASHFDVPSATDEAVDEGASEAGAAKAAKADADAAAAKAKADAAARK